MREDDRDLALLFAEAPDPAPDPAFVARVAGDIDRLRRRRLVLMSAGGLALGLGGGAVLALCAPLLGEAGRMLGEAARTPQVGWAVFAAGLALAVGMPLWRGR
jgi:hypothetical protein